MKGIFKLVLFFVFFLGLKTAYSQETVFKAIKASKSAIYFANSIQETDQVNISMYDYLYNGGGVGIGDFNKDGLSDIFFCGNQVGDKLYINKGNFEFEDITLKAGIAKNGWSTGVCVFDVNNDGLDDIYVCRSGWFENDDSLRNVLYVNQGDLTFKEEAKKYGLDLAGHHIQAAPLDFDLDGDLDLYVIGHPGKFNHASDFKTAIEAINAGEVESDLLMENVDGVYKNITKKAKIEEFGYSLGLSITDVNLDGFPDIIVCNDFDEPDHVFINQQNGTFADKGLSYFKHTSNYSMGNDVGDINNDGLLDFMSVDMAFESHERSKMNMASMDPIKFNLRLLLGWNNQYMHNMLQLNSGQGNFQEISQLSGVSKTDWSWGPLFMDIDKDGYLDLFISNGYKRDTKNNDIQNIINTELEKKNSITPLEAISLIPAVKIKNYFYKNEQDLTFSDQRDRWGVDEKLNSNGAAYADLDNDGDLDLILNNVDTLASIYENTIDSKNHYLTLDLRNLKMSDYLGAKLELKTTNTLQVKEAYFVRGYQSTVENKIHFYWPEEEEVTCLKISMPNGQNYCIELKKIDRTIRLNFKTKDKIESTNISRKKNQLFTEISADRGLILSYFENETNDFTNESLLPHELSKAGPVIAVADFNNDGLDDIIIGSAVGRIPYVIVQKSNGHFAKMQVRSFFHHQMSEDAGIVVFDVNGDSKKDILISSGGYQYPQGDTNYINRLYIGNGTGNFGYVQNALPQVGNNSGKVIAGDIDGDGDTDFFICGAANPSNYPFPGKSSLLINENGFFKDRIKEFAPELEYVGMVNDASFSDIDADGDLDLVVVGEWMDITIFKNEAGKFAKEQAEINRNGWWTSIYATDIDNDGDEDFLVGNAGINNKYNASRDKPLYIYCNDFDDNGTFDIVLSYEKSGRLLPVRGKECSTGQMPFLEKKFPTFISFASSSLEDIYTKEKLDSALSYEANEFRSGILYNNGEAGFSFSPFPVESQISFLNDFEVYDINGDGLKDILAVGNRFSTEVETTRHDAGNGICLIQKSNGEFENMSTVESGFFTPYEATCIEIIRLGTSKSIGFLVGNNKENMQLFLLN